MTSAIPTLLRTIKTALSTLIQFLTIIALGLIAAALLILPWALRVASLLFWLFAGYMALDSIQRIYAPFSDEVPLLALKFAVVIVMVAWLVILMKRDANRLWGGLMAGGWTIWGMSIALNWISSHWFYADLTFRVLPPALFAVLLLYESIRLRKSHKTRAANRVKEATLGEAQ
jgi:FtsH-binding integral membrane protein